MSSQPFRLINEVDTTGFADTNGDGRQELLAYTRTHLWHWAQI